MRRASCLALALFACTAAEPARPASADRAPEPPASPTKAAEPPPATPTPPATTPPATPPATTEPAVPWWCTCYARKVGDADEPVTACRASQDECRELERTVAEGSKDIVAGSVSHACREVLAAHPGDAHGGRDAWKPSKKPGAWLSTGACLLPGEPNPGDAVQPENAIDKFLAAQKLGDLADGMPADQVVARLGQPTKKGRAEFSEATAETLQTWTYKDQGVTLEMSGEPKGEQTIAAITLKAPATLKTDKGVGIGSPKADVLKHYGKQRAEDDEGDDPNLFVAGSIYGGLFFHFKDDKVTEIFLGAGAE